MKHKGEAIKFMREVSMLTQQDLAERVGMKVSMLQRIENTGEGSKRAIKDICEVLEIRESKLG